MVLSQSSNEPQLQVSTDPSAEVMGFREMTIVLPDLTEICPWKWGLNPHYEAIGLKSQEWVDSFNVFSGAKRAFFNASNMGLFGAYAYPHASPEALLACCDWLNVILVVDDYCDEEDGARSREISDAFLDGLKGEPRDGSVFSAIGADFRARHFKYLTKSTQERHIRSFAGYLDSIVRESERRVQGEPSTSVETYLAHRRENGGYQTGYTLFDFVQNTDLPDAVHESPIMKRLLDISVELYVIVNDLYSYKMEVSRGLAESNIITVFMRTEGISLQEAVTRVGEFFRSKIDEFLAEKAEIARRPFSAYGYEKSVDEGVSKTIESMELLCSGYIRWCLNMPRYFGNEYREVSQTRIVKLLVPAEATT